jgi:hypothetical protein
VFNEFYRVALRCRPMSMSGSAQPLSALHSSIR